MIGSHDDLASKGAVCLAEPGKQYAVYLPSGGTVTMKLGPGKYEATWFNPRTGATTQLPAAEGPEWTLPAAPDKDDWALLLRKER